MRQVAHALLTRPPLRLNKNPPKPHQRLISVRLACVRHAASVHLEPGSNSHVKIVRSGQNFKLGFLFCPLLLWFVTFLNYSHYDQGLMKCFAFPKLLLSQNEI